MTQTPGKIGFLFHLGHGHYAQFLNFQECLPIEQVGRPEWIPLPGDQSGDPIANLRIVPSSIRYRRHQVWHAEQGVARHHEWDALFFACMQIGLMPLLQSHRSYLYTDFSPSLKKELAPWYDHQLSRSLPEAWIKDRVETYVYSKLRGLFTMSKWSAEGIHRDYKVPRERIHVALPGANLKRWHAVARDGRDSRQPVKILMVGGEFRRKGGEQMLDWAERTRVRNWELDIVTWPGELPDWVQECLGRPSGDARVTQRLAPRLPNVRVHCGIRANTPEAMQLFADADIFCLPTQADGSSIASLEAMATGLPVLVGAVGGIPELIRDGETGFLLQRGDGNDLECKLERLIADREMRLAVGAAARQSCEDQFNVTRQLNDIFEVLDRDRARPRRIR
jgi:glycosyltransferase involved in cell wall biosynthesis